MKLFKRLILPGLTIVAAAGLLAACSNDYDHCRSCDRDSGYYERDRYYGEKAYSEEGRGHRVDFMGTVYRHNDHYMLRADNGRRYHPLDRLPHRFRRDGLHVRVRGVVHGRAMGGKAYALEIEDIDRA